MKRQSKFNVGKSKDDRTYEGTVFDSAVEMKYYRDVIMPALNNGEIVRCEKQKSYVLQPSFMHNGKKILPIEYKADFVVVYKNGNEQVVDIKGYANDVAKLKRKLFWYTYPDIEYVWIGYSGIDGGWVTYETIKDGRQQRKKNKQDIKRREKDV